MNLNTIMKLNGTANPSSIKQNSMKKYQKEYNKALANKFSHFNMIIGTNRATNVFKDLDENKKTKVIFDLNKSTGKTDLKPLQNKISFANNDLNVGSYITIDNGVENKEINKAYLKDIEYIKYANTKMYKHYVIDRCDIIPYEDHSVGYIKECNNFMTFPIDKNKYMTLPCVIESATLYSDGLNQNKNVVFPDDEISILVPINEHTLDLKINQRFIFNKQYAFYITLFDTWSYAKGDYYNGLQGLLKIHMAREEKRNSMDDLEHNIADNSHIELEDKMPILKQIIGNDFAKMNRLSSWKYDGLDEVLWEVQDADNLIKIEENTSKQIKIFVKKNDMSIGKAFKLILKTKDGKILEEKEISIVSMI